MKDIYKRCLMRKKEGNGNVTGTATNQITHE